MIYFYDVVLVLAYIYAFAAAFALWTTRRRVIVKPEHDPGPWCKPQPRQWAAEIGVEREAS
jgi:hypothetical protein